VMYGYQNITLSEELIQIIEKYISALDQGEIVDASCIYTERVWGGNPKEGEIFAAHLWTRAFDVMNEALTASRNYFLECIANEQLLIAIKATKLAFPNLTDDEIASKADEYLEFITTLADAISLLKEQIQNGGEQHPTQRIESVLEKIEQNWKIAKLEDDETNVILLLDSWYELKVLHLGILNGEKERSEFEENFYYEYMAHLLSFISSFSGTGESLKASLPIDRALSVIEREIALGRLPEDAPLCQNALKAKAEGKNDLIMDDIRAELQGNPLLKISDKITSFLRKYS